jgi:threonine/homoserine/homoserine lactone efflux protein
VAALVIVTPGQDTALTIRNVLIGGRTGGFWTTVGVCAGQATWALVTALGVAALLVASQPAFTALRLAGALYLLFLGARALLAVLRPSAAEPWAARAGGTLTRRVAFRQGLLSNLGNPKMLAFFASLLPQFGHTTVELMALGLLFCSMTFAWLVAYSVVLGRMGDLFRRSSVRRSMEAVTGAVLIALGLRLAAEPA